MKIFCYLLAIVFLLCTTTSSVFAGGCGNNKKDPGGCPSCSFQAYNGNETRAMLDLEVPGSVGEIPLVWERYYNSREFRNWTFSFQYTMVDAGTNSQGQPMITVFFPESGLGFGNLFTQSAANPSVWLPLPGIDKRLFQNGNNFILQMANGYRYRFEKLTTAGAGIYQLQDIRDNYQNLYRLTYNNNHNLIRVTEPAGRYLEMV